MLSYFVVADLLLALHLDAAAVPSTLTVSVEHCSNVWDKLLALYQRRGSHTHSHLYSSLYCRVYTTTHFAGYKYPGRATCIRIQVDRCRRNDNFVADTGYNVDGDKWIQVDTTCIRATCIRCKRSMRLCVL